MEDAGSPAVHALSARPRGGQTTVASPFSGIRSRNSQPLPYLSNRLCFVRRPWLSQAYEYGEGVQHTPTTLG
eukprot:2545632-Pyramimonas_sp.AAC.1